VKVAAHNRRRLLSKAVDDAIMEAETELGILENNGTRMLQLVNADDDDDHADWQRYIAWIHSVQHPPSCAERLQFVEIKVADGSGLGSQIVKFNNAFLEALVRGKGVMFSDKSKVIYVEKRVCPSQMWTCYFQPLVTDSCRQQILTTRRAFKRGSTCANIDTNKLQKLAGLERPHSRLFYEAGALAYLMRPNSRLVKAEQEIRDEIKLPITSTTLSIYIRNGDSHRDGRPYIPLQQYAEMAVMVSLWDIPKLDNIYVGSDDARATEVVRSYFKSKSVRRMGNSLFWYTKVVEIPDKYFMPRELNHPVARLIAGSAAGWGEAGHDPASAVSRDKGWDEGIILLVQIRIMAQSIGFIGSLGGNMNRLVFLLAAATNNGNRPRRSWDALGDTFQGCKYRGRFPYGDWANHVTKSRDKWFKQECNLKAPDKREAPLKKECERVGIK
jgi:hypothetical protein